MKNLCLLFLCFEAFAGGTSYAQPRLKPVPFSEVVLDDGFLKSYADRVGAVTIPVCMDYTEYKTGRIRNFERVGGSLQDRKGHEGIYYDDSDVYKALEAVAYSLKVSPNASIEKRADSWIDKIAAAQQPDGYINTYFTLTGLQNRWTDMEKHEDYCAGHLIEAGIAYYYATGKRKLMDVGIRMANHMDQTFGPGKRHWVTGHQEVELALVKLTDVTGDQRYLHLADWFIRERGHGYGVGKIWENAAMGPGYCQDDVPIEDVERITGHAVRAMYYYTGVADIAARTGNKEYLAAMRRVWEDVVYKNVYLTGAIGSSQHNEGFTKSFDLPNADAYGETCASVGMVFWNERMNALTGDGRYVDVLERSLFNGALAGISLSGDRFFYPNPLASQQGEARKEWFGTACCPSNIARLLASIGNYLYATDNQDIWLNVYAPNHTIIPLKGSNVTLVQKTAYPWEGSVSITISPDREKSFGIHLHIPGWAINQPIPGNLYYVEGENGGIQPSKKAIEIFVNGKPTDFEMADGYAVIHKVWKKGDHVELRLPMEVKRLKALDSVRQDSGRVALQRGPIVYCLEGTDNPKGVFNLILKANTPLVPQWEPNLLGGVYTITGKAIDANPPSGENTIAASNEPFKAIPYFAWANRGVSPMQVWMPEKVTQQEKELSVSP
ncbi:hypothetical protein SAMN05216436_10650 [bacterium A37T11]|nr:hypothetical protein SAMN05216436_10650 [bacterium A37T11]